MSAPKVFISYSHDSPEHSERVLQLSNALRSHGIDVELDRYHVRPPKGWPHWCEEQLRPENSEFVLIVCTQTYLKRVQDKVAADEGRGVFWEGGIIYDYIYDEKGNTRFIPILFSDGIADFIPVPIRNHTRYRVEAFDFTDVGYQNLYRELTGQPLVMKPALGEIIKLGEQLAATVTPLVTREVRTDFAQIAPSRLHYGADRLFGREQELDSLDHAWKDPTKHVLTIVAFGGVGKTSLVIEWMARQAAKNWLGFDRVFDWSFFSQGTREQGSASSDTFIAAALKFFGDEAMAQSAASAWDKGARLARLVAERQSLLVLDGLEPLQHPPGPLAGELKDPALSTLLKSLAQRNSGLCIVTTRETVKDLEPFQNTTAPEWQLDTLREEAGSALLKSLLEPQAPKGRRQVKSSDAERREIVQAVRGHALTLQLLGSFIQRALGDVRKWREVKFTIADAKVQGGYAFKTMGAYEKWLSEGGEEGARQLAVLRLLGLFDRPVDDGCLTALRRKPAIKGLTEPLLELDEADWNLTLSALFDCGLVLLQTDQSGIGYEQSALDAHPLIREYFAKQLREKNSAAWQEGHRRLYEHLRDTTEEGDQPTLEDLQPLYQAVTHACHAGMQQEAVWKVYYNRILRQDEYYAARKLGAIGSNLGAVGCFFELPWTQVSHRLTEIWRAWTLNEASFYLRALGRLTEALDPIQVSGEISVKLEQWKYAALSYINLSELDLSLGFVDRAERDAEQSVTYSDKSGDVGGRLRSRGTHGDALFQAGRLDEALRFWEEAEILQVKHEPNYPLVYSTGGFRYCDLLLSPSEKAAWHEMHKTEIKGDKTQLFQACRAVSMRATKTLRWAEQVSLLSIALDHLTLGRAALYQAILARSEIRNSKSEIDLAVDGLRRAGIIDELPRGLVTRAWLRSLDGNIDGARADLDEAWGIAERGPMRLHMADIHLYRARLFGGMAEGGRMKDEGGKLKYPWDKNPDGSPRGPKDDLAAARKLIEQCGYWRRKEELEDAEAAAENW